MKHLFYTLSFIDFIISLDITDNDNYAEKSIKIFEVFFLTNLRIWLQYKVTDTIKNVECIYHLCSFFYTLTR